MELSSNSLSISISKKLADEEMSMRRATMEDAASRSTGGIRPEAVSNEEIHNGDPILNTYKVTSDAIHGGMGSVWGTEMRLFRRSGVNGGMKTACPGSHRIRLFPLII